MITLSTILVGTSGTFIVNILSAMLKRYVLPRFGVSGMHAAVFGLSLIASTAVQYYMLGGNLPNVMTLEGIKNFSIITGTVFTAAITFYEVLWKRMGMN